MHELDHSGTALLSLAKRNTVQQQAINDFRWFESMAGGVHKWRCRTLHGHEICLFHFSELPAYRRLAIALGNSNSFLRFTDNTFSVKTPFALGMSVKIANVSRFLLLVTAELCLAVVHERNHTGKALVSSPVRSISSGHHFGLRGGGGPFPPPRPGQLRMNGNFALWFVPMEQ